MPSAMYTRNNTNAHTRHLHRALLKFPVTAVLRATRPENKTPKTVNATILQLPTSQSGFRCEFVTRSSLGWGIYAV
jgi:hypothetical protein